MVEFNWIKISLILSATLQFAAVNGQSRLSVTVRAGDEVTLPCKNVMKDQDKCNSTDWFVTAYTRASTKTLVNRGQISKKEISESTYNRLSITESCSLVIKNVTRQDVGRYICRQYRKSGGEPSEDDVYLSVVNLEKHQVDDGATLFCTVVTYDSRCEHTVKWLHDDNLDVEVTELHGCSASLTFKTSHVNQKSNLLKCEVTDHQSGEKLLYDFSSGESKGGTTTENNASSTEEVTPPQACAGCSVVDYVMLVLRVAELVLITVITVLLVRAQGNQRPPDGSAVRRRQMNHDEDDDVVNYENSPQSVRLH